MTATNGVQIPTLELKLYEAAISRFKDENVRQWLTGVAETQLKTGEPPWFTPQDLTRMSPYTTMSDIELKLGQARFKQATAWLTTGGATYFTAAPVLKAAVAAVPFVADKTVQAADALHSTATWFSRLGVPADQLKPTIAAEHLAQPLEKLQQSLTGLLHHDPVTMKVLDLQDQLTHLNQLIQADPKSSEAYQVMEQIRAGFNDLPNVVTELSNRTTPTLDSFKLPIGELTETVQKLSDQWQQVYQGHNGAILDAGQIQTLLTPTNTLSTTLQTAYEKIGIPNLDALHQLNQNIDQFQSALSQHNLGAAQSALKQLQNAVPDTDGFWKPIHDMVNFVQPNQLADLSGEQQKQLLNGVNTYVQNLADSAQLMPRVGHAPFDIPVPDVPANVSGPLASVANATHDLLQGAHDGWANLFDQRAAVALNHNQDLVDASRRLLEDGLSTAHVPQHLDQVVHTALSHHGDNLLHMGAQLVGDVGSHLATLGAHGAGLGLMGLGAGFGALALKNVGSAGVRNAARAVNIQDLWGDLGRLYRVAL